MILQVEVCHKHGMFREENGTWQGSDSAIEVTDNFDEADFIESTCPCCSSADEYVGDLFDIMHLT